MTKGLVTNRGVAISLSLSIVFPIKPICKCPDTSEKKASNSC